jgi:hypothetical protein
MTESDVEAKYQRRRVNGIRIGAALIAYTVFRSIVSLINGGEAEWALLYAAIGIAGGGGLILWCLGPGRSWPKIKESEEAAKCDPERPQYDEDGRNRSKQ